jgi:hypothetical protein
MERACQTWGAELPEIDNSISDCQLPIAILDTVSTRAL